MTYETITRDTCIHDAKVKMAGYKDMYECTRCHSFISVVTPKEEESRNDDAPDYMESNWEDDD